MAYYSGRVHTIVFENAAQGFYILRVLLDGSGTVPVVVRGNIPGMDVKIGTWLSFEADKTVHPKYGQQYAITKAPVVPRWDAATSASILINHGVPDKIANAIRDELGASMLSILDTGDGTALQAVTGVTPTVSAYVLSRWQVARSFIETMTFLAETGLPASRMVKVMQHFGDKTYTVLSTNPWALTQLEGFSFKDADAVAIKLGLDMTSPERLKGAVQCACRDRRGFGHIFLRTGEIFEAVVGWCPAVTQQDLATAIKEMVQEKRIILDRTTRPGTIAVYEPWSHKMECLSASLLLERQKTAVDTELVRRFKITLGNLPDDPHVCAQAAIEQWSLGSKITLSAAQQQGAVNALVEPVSVLTGLPGTGKTTSLRAVVQILRSLQLRCLLIAPTGIAAKRMSLVTGVPASTIHRAFGARGWAEGQQEREATYVGVTGNSGGVSESDGSGEVWACSKNHYPADVIIVDEASMVDQHLLYRILTCTRPEARIVFIGDAAQLPSVGPGNVLRDMIQSGAFPTVSLTDIYRQSDTSDIVLAAHAINNGEFPEARTDTSSDFRLLPVYGDQQVLEKILELARKLHDRGIAFQVMSPRHAGTVGVTAMNAQLRELLNPQRPGLSEVRIGSEVLREGDRVMVVKNNYDFNIFNGDVGTVVRLNLHTSEVEVDIQGSDTRVVMQLKDAADHLRLAYAVTVHKMQGQEVDAIVLPWVVGFYHQLQRNLLYTAITRAKKKVFIVGTPEAVQKAVDNANIDVRNTLFSDRLMLGGVTP